MKQIDEVMSSVYERDYSTGPSYARDGLDELEGLHSQKDLDARLAGLQEAMRQAATNLDFEKAASLRDQIKRLRNPDLALRWPVGRT